VDTGPVRVLVVDDQLPFRRAVRAVLGAMTEFELVGESTSGEEAVSAASTLRPDLVLMDVHMTGLDGIEATRLIAAERPATMVVLVSSYRAEDLAAAVAESGAFAFLPKDRFGASAIRELWSSRARSAAPTGTRARPSPDG